MDFGSSQKTNSPIYSTVDMKILIIMMDLVMFKIGKFLRKDMDHAIRTTW